MKKNTLVSKFILRGAFLAFMFFVASLSVSYAQTGGGSTTIPPLPVPPTVETKSPIPSSTSAVLQGSYIGSDTDPTYTEFLWGTSQDNLSYATGWVKQNDTSGTFSENITGLTPDTQYYFQALGKNLLGGVGPHAQITSFRTDPTPAPTADPCSVKSFTARATNNTINQWNSTTLDWTHSNCTSLTLSSSDGKYVNTSVIKKSSIPTGSLGQTTSYLLIGTDAAGNISQLSLTITVIPLSQIGNINTGNGGSTTVGDCQIYSFTVNGSNYVQIEYNGGATLSWNTSLGCTSVVISGDNGTKFSDNPNQSTLYLTPFKKLVNYTLIAKNANGVGPALQVTVAVSRTSTVTSGGNCNITSFNSSALNVSSGQKVTLSWSTSGSCTNVTLTGTSDSIPFKYSLPANGSVSTNPLYGTSTFNITANGSVSSTYPPLTVYVTGGPYPYDNGQVGGNVITIVATNVGVNSVRLNGLFVASPNPTIAWFEYGTDTNLNATTPPQSFDGGVTRSYYDTIITNPKTTYYFRAVSKVNGVIYKGSIMSVITKEISNNNIIYTQSTSSNNTTSVAASTSTGVVLSITNKGDKVFIGDTIDYTINYSNGSTKKISNVGINITLPQGFTLVQTTKGQTISPTMISVNVGTLAPGQSDTIFLQAKVESNVSLTNTLVTNGTLSFTNPNGSNDSTVGYVLNHAGGVAALGGFSFGAGFFPTTVLGWIVTIFIILAIILTIRRISKAKHGTGAMHH
jgi:hypothetical protein